MPNAQPLPGFQQVLRDLEWRRRELLQFVKGEYTPVPWHSEPWYQRSPHSSNHFAHVSKDEPSKLAYTPDSRHGREDRQLRTKPGRYLTKYFKDTLPSAEIQRWAQEWAGRYETHELQLARTPDDVERVYLAGPDSCMSKAVKEYDGDEHPTRAYGDSDLAIAYMERGGEITARTVCWPGEKIFSDSSIYGDEDRLYQALETAGYASGTLKGARIRAIPCGAGFIAPYMNGGYYAEDTGGGFLTLRSSGIPLQETCGVIGAGEICCRCEERYPEGEGVHVDGENETWCPDCAQETEVCENCNERQHSNDMLYLESVCETWCNYCAQEHASHCVGCQSVVPDRNAVDVDDATYCEACHADLPTCENCNDTHTESGLQTFEGEQYCETCYSDLPECPDCPDKLSKEQQEGSGYCDDCEPEK